jgi:Ca2+-binding RTX toxin-like protein
VTFDGGPGDDWLQSWGDYAGNVLDGGTGSDILVDFGSGTGGDYLYGGDSNEADCLQAECVAIMDRGGGSDGYATICN